MDSWSGWGLGMERVVLDASSDLSTFIAFVEHHDSRVASVYCFAITTCTSPSQSFLQLCLNEPGCELGCEMFR